MVDLETLGQRPGCVILSIGAVQFDPKTGKLGKKFYKVVRTQSCLDAGLAIDEATQTWWAQQAPEARAVVDQALQKKGTLELAKALTEFGKFIAQSGGGARVWGNGSDFDNAILAVAYHKAGLELPWKFWNNRCFRTLKSLPPARGLKVEREGTYHNALDDAITQAKHALLIYGALNGRAGSHD
jgi:exodeoxyribonuclease VIII